MTIKKNNSMNEIEKKAVDLTNMVIGLPYSKLCRLEDMLTRKQLSAILDLCDVVKDECGKRD